jgi:hypothetical protein
MYCRVYCTKTFFNVTCTDFLTQPQSLQACIQPSYALAAAEKQKNSYFGATGKPLGKHFTTSALPVTSQWICASGFPVVNIISVIVLRPCSCLNITALVLKLSM